MTAAEIQLKMGIDGSSMAQDLRQSKAHLTDFAETGHKSFLHAGSGAKEFHKVLHSLVEESPLVGLAIKAAFSPIGAALAGAVLAFTWLNKKIEETNKWFDRMGEAAAKPVGDAREMLSKVAEETAKASREAKEFAKSLEMTAADKIKTALAEQLDLMKAQNTEAKTRLEIERDVALEKLKQDVSSGRMGPGAAAMEEYKIRRKQVEDERALKLKAAVDELEANKRSLEETRKAKLSAAETVKKFEADANDAGRKRSIESGPATIKGLEEQRKTMQGRASGLAQSQEDLSEGYMANIDAWLKLLHVMPWMKKKGIIPDIEGEQADATEKAAALAKEIQLATDRLRQNKIADEEAKDGLKDSREHLKELNTQFKQLSENVTKSANRLKELANTPTPNVTPPDMLNSYRPTIQTLAGRRGPYQNIANQVLQGEQNVQNRLVQGDEAGAERIRRNLEGYDETRYVYNPKGMMDRRSKMKIGSDEWNKTQAGAYTPETFHVPGLRDRLPKPPQDEMQKLQAQMAEHLKALASTVTNKALQVNPSMGE